MVRIVSWRNCLFWVWLHRKSHESLERPSAFQFWCCSFKVRAQVLLLNFPKTSLIENCFAFYPTFNVAKGGEVTFEGSRWSKSVLWLKEPPAKRILNTRGSLLNLGINQLRGPEVLASQPGELKLLFQSQNEYVLLLLGGPDFEEHLRPRVDPHIPPVQPQTEVKGHASLCQTFTEVR